MLQTKFFSVGLTALAVAALWLAGSPVEAAPHGGVHGGGFHAGGFRGGVAHGGFSGGGFRGVTPYHYGGYGGFRNYGYSSFGGYRPYYSGFGNRSFYPGYSRNLYGLGGFGYYPYGLGYGYGSGYSPYGYSGLGYSSSYYGYGSAYPNLSYSSNSIYVNPGYLTPGFSGVVQSGYTPPVDTYAAPADYNGTNGVPQVSAEAPAYVEVRVSLDAEVWFGGYKTTQTGSDRNFVSPPLSPGKSYAYQVRARWNSNGQPVEQERSVVVHAGERVVVDFLTSVSNSSGLTGSVSPTYPPAMSRIP